MKVLIKIFFFFFLTVACKGKHNNPRDNEASKILDSKFKILYIEERNEKEGSNYGEFGDIICFDIQNNIKIKITDDTIFDEHPVWINGGVKILFSSPDRTKLRKFERELEKVLYIFDLNKMKIQNFEAENKIKHSVSHYTGLSISHNDSLIIYSNADRKIYIKSFRNGEIIREIPLGVNVQHIDNLFLSHNEKYLAFSYYSIVEISEMKYGLGWLNLENEKINYIKETDRYITLGGWDKNNKGFLYIEDSLYHFNIFDEMSSKLVVNGLNDEFTMRDFQYIDENIIMFIYNELIYNKKLNMKTQEGKKGIAKFDLSDSSLYLLDYNLKQKSNLSIFYTGK